MISLLGYYATTLSFFKIVISLLGYYATTLSFLKIVISLLRYYATIHLLSKTCDIFTRLLYIRYYTLLSKTCDIFTTLLYATMRISLLLIQYFFLNVISLLYAILFKIFRNCDIFITLLYTLSFSRFLEIVIYLLHY